MSNPNEAYFPPDFILNYIHQNPETGIRRVLTYTIFRLFSFTGKEKKDLSATLKKDLFPEETSFSFDLIEQYLAADCYFSPSFEENSFDPFYLYAAITIADGALAEYAIGNELDFADNLIADMYPALSSTPLDNEALQLDALIQSGSEFYAGLYLVLTKYSSSAGILLPKFAAIYRTDYLFTCGDFVLYDFMDEYFEQENCRFLPSYLEMIDTLVQATLGYYKTDFETLLSGDVSAILDGSSSRFSILKRFGAQTIPYLTDRSYSLFLLQEVFRYAAAYELRSNLFDYHLEEDNLITLENWKEKLRWHYVQYSNVFEPALDTFFAAVLSRKLVKAQFQENLAVLA